ncbi:MAG: hypothetical protein IAI49_03625 [Candidatus Eremiobacteraeota bacterium]|nr:hypothetical protein [Candidatus Eremiobacteraeota bacterium]
MNPTPAVWAITLLAAGLAANRFLACGSSLIAFAVIAAVTLRFRVAAAIALGIWAESQFLGFTIFNYPHEAMTVAWGAALGCATLLATGIAAWYAGRSRLGAFVAAFVAYELALAGFALLTHSGLGGFTAAIVVQIFISNALVALGAIALYAASGWLESTVWGNARPGRNA